MVRGNTLSSVLVNYLERVEIDHEGAEPVYRQLAAILRARIRAGEFAPGRPIPSETTLMQQYGLARETCRKAVRVLRDEGLVIIVQGRGAYVTKPGEHQ
jgi:GntR family transcriptional regulator